MPCFGINEYVNMLHGFELSNFLQLQLVISNEVLGFVSYAGEYTIIFQLSQLRLLWSIVGKKLILYNLLVNITLYY